MSKAKAPNKPTEVEVVEGAMLYRHGRCFRGGERLTVKATDAGAMERRGMARRVRS
jgi:hypothetical protein